MNKAFDLRTGKSRQIKTGGNASPVKDEDVTLSENLLQEYDSARQEWAKSAHEDDEFRNNRQWTEEQTKELERDAQIPIVVNVVHSVVEQAKALLTSNRPRFTSTGREDSDTKVGKLFADILTYVWDTSGGNQQLKETIDDYYVRGMGTMIAYADLDADMGKGEVFVRNVDPFDVFFDPNSRDIFCRDAAHIILARTVTAEQFQQSYPRYAWALEKAQRQESDRHPGPVYVSRQEQRIGTEVYDSMSSRYEQIDRYSRIKLFMYHSADSSSAREFLHTEEEYQTYLGQPVAVISIGGKQQIETDPARVAEVQGLVMQFGETFHSVQDPVTGNVSLTPGPAGADTNALPGSETTVRFATIADMVAIGVVVTNKSIENRILRVLSLGGVKLYRGVLDLEDYPIVPLMNRHNRNPYPGSDVRIVRPIQQYINKLRSLIMTHAANSTNIKVFLPRGGVNKKELQDEWAKAGTAVIEYDPEVGIPIIAAPPPLPNELYRNEADARKDIEQIFGIYALMQGDTATAPNTYKGTVALDEYGQRRIKSKKDDVEAFLNQLARIVVQLVQKTYTVQKTIRIVQPNDAPKEVVINQPIYDQFTKEQVGRINDITAGRYDVVVVSGSMLPSNRWAQFEYYMMMYEKGLIDQVEALKKSELVDVEGVLNRFSELQRLKQMVSQLQEENKKLAGDLQTAEREWTHASKRVEVEKFKRQLGDISSRADKAATLYEARLADELKMQKQEETGESQTPVVPDVADVEES